MEGGLKRGTTIQRRLALGFSIGPLILAVIATIIFFDTQGMIDRRAQTRATYDIMLNLSEISANLSDLETGARGFVLTGDDAYLKPYELARTDLDQRLAKLAEQVSDPTEARLAMTLRDLAAQKKAVLDQNIALRRGSGFEAAVRSVNTGKGRELMSQARSIMDEIEGRQGRLLDRRTAESVQLENLTLNTVIFGTLGCFAVLVVLGAVTIRAITAPVRSTVDALASTSAEILAGATQQAASMRQ
jgi:CHASE3 domain sensor protein